MSHLICRHDSTIENQRLPNPAHLGAVFAIINCLGDCYSAKRVLLVVGFQRSTDTSELPSAVAHLEEAGHLDSSAERYLPIPLQTAPP